MYVRELLVGVTGLLATVLATPLKANTIVQDAETGFTFSQYTKAYTTSKGSGTITVRVATPSSVTADSPFDVVIQVAAPVNLGWVGVAWGGVMAYNPLSVGWSNGNSAMVSSRRATGHTMPQTFSGATYTLLKTGTHTNATHWQYTAKCTGCTAFTDGSGDAVVLAADSFNRMALAWCGTGPSSRGSASSDFPVHDNTGYFSLDFSAAGNAGFAALVTKNGGK